MRRRLWLSEAHAAAIRAEAECRYPLETGGILVGYRGGDSGNVITDVIGPGLNAKHGRTWFLPDHRFHDKEVARLYEQSGRHHVYLGDWHSHPNGPISLSWKDTRTLRRIATDRHARLREPVMLIVAGSLNQGWALACFQTTRVRWIGLSVERLELTSFIEQ
jgi:integrative and conjugative element protein (TIGR02256 family)